MSTIWDQLEEYEKKEAWKKKVKAGLEKVKEGATATVEWCNENKEIIAVAVPVILLGIKKIDKHLDVSREAKLKECSIYDHSMGMYLVSKKPLTTAQKLDIDALHKAGMSYREIGKELGIKWR